MAALKRSLTSTQRALSRSGVPFLQIQGKGSPRTFPKISEGYLKTFAVVVVVLGLSTSTFCSRKLSSEKKDCNPFKRLFSAASQPSETKDAKDHHVSVGVKDLK